LYGHGGRGAKAPLPILRTWLRRSALCQQVVVFGMLAHEALDELALDRELAPLSAHRIERCPRQLRADALAAEFGRHFGMDERDRAGRFTVSDESARSPDVEFKSVAIFVVAEIVGHAEPLYVGCTTGAAGNTTRSSVRQ